MYEWTTRIRYSEIDSTGKLTIPAMVNLFQDCVNFESEEIGMGMLWLNENGMSWIILNWQIEVERMPGMGGAHCGCHLSLLRKKHFRLSRIPD